MYVPVSTTPARSLEQSLTQPIVICVLGSFRVLAAGRPVSLRGGSKAEALLCALALNGEHGQTRERLIDSLWPDAEPSLAGQSLNSLVYSLHRLLGPHLSNEPPVFYTGGWYRLNLEAGVAVDLHLFETAAARGDEQSHAHETNRAATSYQEAINLYRGDLCGGTDVHGLVERERVRARYLNVLAHLADHHFVHGEYEACLDVVLRLLAVDPCREDAHRLAMRCYVRRGERAQALRQYRLCEAILLSEFDAPPEASTRALFDKLRTDPETL